MLYTKHDGVTVSTVIGEPTTDHCASVIGKKSEVKSLRTRRGPPHLIFPSSLVGRTWAVPGGKPGATCRFLEDFTFKGQYGISRT